MQADSNKCKFSPWVEKILWRKEWTPIPVFLPEKFHGQRSLVGYSPWGHRESDMTERLMLIDWAYGKYSSGKLQRKLD